MQNMDILEEIFDKKVLKILRLFYKFDSKEFYVREIARQARVSMGSTFRIVSNLVRLNLIDQILVRRFKLYKLADNEASRFLGQMVKVEKQVLEVFITRAKHVKGIQTILLQGKEEKDRANLIIIGDKIDPAKIKEICAEIREQMEYLINPLILTEEQFQQMDSMGLYPGKKKTIFKV